MPKVAIVRCDSYDYALVKIAVEKGINLIGGPNVFVEKGEKILLKPNLLSADSHEKCVTTHPSVFKAVAEVFKKAGAILSYGDSPAFQNTDIAAQKSGIAAVADELGVKLANFNEGQEVSFPEGIQNKKFIIAKGVLENDGLVSLPKLKTHAYAKMTGSIKNQFGCIPGTLKGEFHVKLPDVNNFSTMLIDLNRFIKPRLFIMDGIYAMEGNGPRGGNPIKMNILMFSLDPIALDATVCRIIKLNPEFVPTIKIGSKAGLGTYLENEIELIGDDINGFINQNFAVKREPLKPFKVGIVLGLLRNLVVPKPFINHVKCKNCGICVKMCPVEPKAVNWHNGDRKNKPSHLYKNCIRCYCCQELCPESAITLKVPFIRKMIKRK